VTGVVLFVAAAGLYVVATVRREGSSFQYGDLRQDRLTTALALTAICVSLCAVGFAAVSMVIQS
jgi:hypothetical protein